MRPDVQKPARLHDLGAQDISSLKTLAARLPEALWNSEDAGKENKFFCFTNTRHIIFRFFPPNGSPDDAYAHPIWSAWQDTLTPIMQAAAKPYGYAQPLFPKVMLARLAAGHSIDRHTDAAATNRQVHKIHVPLVTNPKAKMFIADEWFHLQDGRAYEVNNIVPHGVENAGDEDRVHFIFELYDGLGTPSALG